jgi:hypothetical protein
MNSFIINAAKTDSNDMNAIADAILATERSKCGLVSVCVSEVACWLMRNHGANVQDVGRRLLVAVVERNDAIVGQNQIGEYRMGYLVR